MNATPCAPPRAAKGDDDVMSTQCPSNAFAEDTPATQWQDQIAAAQLNWPRLPHSELTRVDGREDQLVRLLREHYLLSHGLANRQARDFFSKHMA